MLLLGRLEVVDERTAWRAALVPSALVQLVGIGAVAGSVRVVGG